MESPKSNFVLPENSLVLSADEDESLDNSARFVKRKRLLIDDSEDEETEEAANSSKKALSNLKSLCDEESSEDEAREKDEEENSNSVDADEKITEDRPRKSPLESSSDDDTSNDEESADQPAEPKAKNLQRKAKTEAENVISMIQKNAREDELSVPYHCPEQKSLKDFLEALKSSKGRLVVEEKVEIKTHKFKLLKDVPKLTDPDSVAPLETEGVSAEEQQTEASTGMVLGPTLGGAEKLTLKGDPNSMIDLETGQTFVHQTVADKLIGSLMRHSRSGPSNDSKFKPEPVPGAPLKQLKRNLECELERKKTEMIMRIMKGEKDKKEDEDEEMLEDDEYELDSEDDTKKRKKTTKEDVEEEPEKVMEFNEDEEEVEGTGEEPNEEPVEADGQEGCESETNDGEAEEESDSDESDEEGDQLDTCETHLGKRTLKRIVAMDDSDDEQPDATFKAPTGKHSDPPEDTELSTAAPLFEDIPTEPLRTFEYSATQNDNELFALCSGTFATQPSCPVEDSSQLPAEASQVKDFEFPTESPQFEREEASKEVNNPVEQEQQEPVAGPQVAKFNLSSSEDEEAANPDSEKRKRKTIRKKKKRIFIQDDDEEENDLPTTGDHSDSGEEEDESDNDDPAEPAIEELEEYKSFLSGKPSEAAAGAPKSNRMKVTDFLEKEAELSDSEWGSEDEDERGLDRDEDIGLVRDDENFDGEVLRDEVGRIHMRQMVNEDNRELKYLKDLILNEEETDGQGRQRTFRWQNLNGEADDFNSSVKVPGEEGEDKDGEEDDEEENEANWRKLRLEREKALEENKQTVTIQTRFDEVMQMSRNIKVVNTSSTPKAIENVLKENSSPSFLMQDQSKKFMNLRQSFLLRDEETLNRLAVSTKSDGTSTSDGKGNFVFRRIEEKAVPNQNTEPPKKRKSNGTAAPSQPFPMPKKRKV